MRVNLTKATNTTHEETPGELASTPECPECGHRDWETFGVEVWSKVSAFVVDEDGDLVTEGLKGEPAGGADDHTTGLYSPDAWGVSCIACGHQIHANEHVRPAFLAGLGTHVAPAGYQDAPTAAAAALLPKLEALLWPENYPEGHPQHDRNHGFWESDGDAYEWDHDTTNAVAELAEATRRHVLRASRQEGN